MEPTASGAVGRRRPRAGKFVLGPGTATAGWIGVLVLLGCFLVVSRWNVHHHAESIVDQNRMNHLAERLRGAALDEEMVGFAPPDVPTEELAHDLRATHDAFVAALGDLSDLAPYDIDDEVEDLTRLHGAVDWAAVELLTTRDRSEDHEAAVARFRVAIDDLVTAVDRTGCLARRSLDGAIGDLASTDRGMRIWAPIVFVLCSGALAAFAVQLGRYRRRIEHQVFHDALTGLANRTMLIDRMDHALAIARRTGVDTALLIVDLDRFKEINDTLGHDYGDLVLAEIGPRLIGRLRDSDTVARLGGDEFGILLTNISGAPAAVRVAEELATALREPFHAGALSFDVEASIGIAIAPDHGTTSTELVQRADIAMYLAKTSHANVALYRPEADQHSPERLALLGELRHAIEADELVLYFQPKNSMRTQEVTGVEALVRWLHPTRGLVPPDDFVPLAEHTSLIDPLTTWVARAAARQSRVWADQGVHLTIAVNVSARTLGDLSFADRMSAIVAAEGVDPSAIEIEVTETSIMREPERALTVMNALSELGFSIAIDDFGTGFTSLSSLRTLPVDALKIDRTFVSNLHTVVELGRNLGLEVIAEGVEDDETRMALDALGCTTGQGYLWSRPLPAEAFERWLDEGGRRTGSLSSER